MTENEIKAPPAALILPPNQAMIIRNVIYAAVIQAKVFADSRHLTALLLQIFTCFQVPWTHDEKMEYISRIIEESLEVGRYEFEVLRYLKPLESVHINLDSYTTPKKGEPEFSNKIVGNYVLAQTEINVIADMIQHHIRRGIINTPDSDTDLSRQVSIFVPHAPAIAIIDYVKRMKARYGAPKVPRHGMLPPNGEAAPVSPSAWATASATLKGDKAGTGPTPNAQPASYASGFERHAGTQAGDGRATETPVDPAPGETPEPLVELVAQPAMRTWTGRFTIVETTR